MFILEVVCRVWSGTIYIAEGSQSLCTYVPSGAESLVISRENCAATCETLINSLCSPRHALCFAF